MDFDIYENAKGNLVPCLVTKTMALQGSTRQFFIVLFTKQVKGCFSLLFVKENLKNMPEILKRIKNSKVRTNNNLFIDNFFFF
jgi:hypothetical protein